MAKAWLVVAVMTLVSCSSSAVGPGPYDGDFLRATVEGKRVAATGITAKAGDPTTITAQWMAGDTTRKLVFFIVGGLQPGTVSLASYLLTYASYFETVGGQTAEWTTAIFGSSGSITFTVKSATCLAGTFSFLAVPVPNTGATKSRTVTDGSFDIIPAGQ